MLNSNETSKQTSRSDSLLDLDIVRDLNTDSLPENYEYSSKALELHRQTILADESALDAKSRKLYPYLRVAYKILSVLVAIVIILLLLGTLLDFPSFGQENNPVNNEVYERYLVRGLEEGGATNLVSNIILDYRAFDTLGESNVLFTAVCAVVLLLRINGDERPSSGVVAKALPRNNMVNTKNDPILSVTAGAVIPAILMFGVYVVLNGHLGPGGGFSGGAVMGAGLILYVNSTVENRLLSLLKPKIYNSLLAIALGFYALSKFWSFLSGANGFPSGISNGIPGRILSAGLILPLNVAVGMVVCLTMYGFYSLFLKGEI